MLLHLFDKASIHTRDMLKNTIFSLNKENHFTHYHACSVSIKNQSSNACFQVLLVKLPIYAYSLAQQKLTQHHFFHYYNFVHLIKCFTLRGKGEVQKFPCASTKQFMLELKSSGRLRFQIIIFKEKEKLYNFCVCSVQ